MTVKRLPAWFYGGIAAIPVSILALFYSSLDPISRIDVAIPAVFWTLAFLVIGWRRRQHQG
jgi:hypothetical protein